MEDIVTPKTSRDLPGPGPETDAERDTKEAVIKDATQNDGRDRDEVHGDGDQIGLDKD